MRLILIALATGLTATSAQADGVLVGSCTIPLTRPPATREVSCPVNLVKGQDYDIVSEYDCYDPDGTAALVNPAGVTTIGPSTLLSREFRAAYTARYYIKITGDDYLANLFTDCQGSTKTQCSINLGKKISGYDTAFADTDWYR